MAIFDPKLLEAGIQRFKERHGSKIVAANGATILEPGIRKICSKYGVEVEQVGFSPDHHAVEVILRKGKDCCPFEIQRVLIENDDFDMITHIIEKHAQYLVKPELRDDDMLERAVKDAIKELIQ